jgi:hypothetical protein
MSNDFHTLMEFLGRLGPEVTGHNTATPDPQNTQRLERLVVGMRPGPDRLETCELLRLHPAWLRWLADRVRMARTQQTPSS